MELSIADYLIEVQFCIPFLCEEVNRIFHCYGWGTKLYPNNVEVYNSCEQYFPVVGNIKNCKLPDTDLSWNYLSYYNGIFCIVIVWLKDNNRYKIVPQ
jgi:hypothetical protein